MNNIQKIEVQVINAFVDDGSGGNPAGVVLDANNLNNLQKQVIAQKLGLSETAFVSASAMADFKLDFFTPTKQIAHCGHATIATFSYLSQSGKIKNTNSSKETIDGVREIQIKGELAFMEQKAPVYTDIESHRQRILESLGIKENDLLAGAELAMVNTGNSFFIIPVADKAVLKNLKPNFDLINQLSEEFNLIGYYVFTTETNIAGRDASARMFAPRYGIMEEAGTGMAAGPLAAFLFDKMQVRKTTFLVEQGWYMQQPSPSLITVELTLNKNIITKIMAGGKGVPVRKIIVEI